MSQSSNQWGIELNGEDRDKEVWRDLLKAPFDPYVEEVKDTRGDYLALRSSAFDGGTQSDVHQAAKLRFKTLNVAMEKNADADPVRNGAVVEFVAQVQPKRHHFIEAEPISFRIGAGVAHLTRMDAQGNIIEPTPSALQDAALDARGLPRARDRERSTLSRWAAGMGRALQGS